jgi:hypothetical protein
MRNSRFMCGLRIVPALWLILLIPSGCSKKAAEAPAPAPAAADAAAPADAAPAPAAVVQPAQTAPQAPTGPVLDTSQMVGDAKAAMAEADAALRQREYEKAVRTMLAIQQAKLDAQQAALAHQQMINLQRNLANAVASGDPNAQAAANLLRASHSH